MKLNECMKCPAFVESRADCVICKYEGEVEHRVIDKDNVISCPKK